MLARFALVIYAFSLVSCHTSEPSLWTIGIVNPVTMREQVVDDFIVEMTEAGYIEGENIIYRYEGAIPDDTERLAWARQLVAEEVDLIFAVATPGAQTAAEATDTIPIVFVPVTDPIGAGLVENLQTLDGNITGITNGNPHALRLQFLVDLMPEIDKVFVPINLESSPITNSLPSVTDVAERNDIILVTPDVRDLAGLETAFEEIPDDIDAIFVMPDPPIAEYTTQRIDELIASGVPLISLSRTEVEKGALLAYGEELDAASAQAARLVQAILQGTSPSDLPIETAEYFLSLNLETAHTLDIEVSDEFLQRVNFIIRAEG